MAASSGEQLFVVRDNRCVFASATARSPVSDGDGPMGKRVEQLWPAQVTAALSRVEASGVEERLELGEGGDRRALTLTRLREGGVLLSDEPLALQARLASVLQTLEAPYWEQRVGETPVFFSGRLDELLAAPPAPHTDWRFVHPADLPMVEARLAALAADGAPFRVAVRVPHAPGWQWIELSGQVTQRDDAGRPALLAGHLTARPLEERRLAQAAAATKTGFFAYDLRTDSCWRTPAHAELLDVDRDVHQPWSLHDLLARVCEEDRARLLRAFAEADATGVLQVSFRVAARTGVRWLALDGRVVKDERGVPLERVGTITDVTPHAHELSALEERTRRAQDHLAQSPVALFETDAEGRATFLNAAAEALLGVAPGEARGASWNQVVHPDDRERVTRAWYEAVREGRPFVAEYRLARGDGERLAHCRAVAMRDAHGQVSGYLGVVVDTTAHDDHQRGRERAARLEALGSVIGGLAHELNNPLAADLGNQRLALADLEEALRLLRAATELPRAAAHLEAGVEALRDSLRAAARIAGIVEALQQLHPREGPFGRVALGPVVARALAGLGPEAAQVRVEGAAPDVLGVERHLVLLLAELLDNALKASGHGSVEVLLGATPAGWASLEVRDHGSGIAGGALHRVFDPFFSTREVGAGRGLGLTRVHAIVVAHGGRLSHSSAQGDTRFVVELPPWQDAARPG